MTSTDAINYAHVFGIHSVAAPIIFLILYVPLFAWFVRLSIRRPTGVFILSAIFSSVRIIGFAMRAVLADSESAGENLTLLIVDEIMFTAGYVGLLYSAYSLVLDRELLSGVPPSNNVILRLTGNRHLLHFTMLGATALGIVGAIKASSTTASASQKSLGNNLRTAGVIIFLILTILQAYRTVLLNFAERDILSSYKRDNENFGMRHGVHILCAISVLLLIREAFTAATVRDQAKANNEHLWYPFVAIPEILALALYATPGLAGVTPRSELPT